MRGDATELDHGDVQLPPPVVEPGRLYGHVRRGIGHGQQWVLRAHGSHHSRGPLRASERRKPAPDGTGPAQLGVLTPTAPEYRTIPTQDLRGRRVGKPRPILGYRTRGVRGISRHYAEGAGYEQE